MRLIKNIFKFITLITLFQYIVTVIRVMKAKRRYDKAKRKAWNMFYASNKKWLTDWYKTKGLNSKPPVHYDQRQQRWVKLNRKARRNLK